MEILRHFELVMEILQGDFPKKLTDITPEYLFASHRKIAAEDLPEGL
jgi:hypothetical protein